MQADGLPDPSSLNDSDVACRAVGLRRVARLCVSDAIHPACMMQACCVCVCDGRAAWLRLAWAWRAGVGRVAPVSHA